MKKLHALFLAVLILTGFSTVLANSNPPANDPPVITISGNTQICLGGSTTLTASGGLSYSWTTGLPLDNIASTVMAVGLHKLKSSYTGFALELSRSSDNTRMSFGFLGNELDMPAITAFLNGSDGYCTKLYDQSGNGKHMETAYDQVAPSFVANGQNGKPVLHFGSTLPQYMYNLTAFSTPFSVVYMAKQTGPTRKSVLTDTWGWSFGWANGAKDQANFNGWIGPDGTPPADNEVAIYGATNNGSNASVYKNGHFLFSNSVSQNSAPQYLFLNTNIERSSDFDFMDLCMFNDVLLDENRSHIENAMESYYLTGENGGQVTVSPTSTTTYTVTGTGPNGESSTASITVVVAETSITPGDAAIICDGSSITLTANTGAPYLWSTGETTQSIIVDTPGVFTLQANNCPLKDSVRTFAAAISPEFPALCDGNVTLAATRLSSSVSVPWAFHNQFTTAVLDVPETRNISSLNFTTSGVVVPNSGTIDIKIDLYNPRTAVWVNVYSSPLSAGQAIYFNNFHVTFPVVSAVSRFRLTSNPEQANIFSYFFSGGTLTLNVANPFTYLWNTGDTTAVINVHAPGLYGVSISGCPSIPVTVMPPPGDSSVFGNNSWIVYAWNAGEANDTTHSWNTNYSGYYTDDSFNFNTLNKWGLSESPSYADNYLGCPVSTDNHSWSAKRQGFPCGSYQVDIRSHDDAGQLYINGIKVWEHIGCCDIHNNVWRGFLDSNSRVEFRATEGGGGSTGWITFTPILELSCPANDTIIVNIPAGQCTATVIPDPPVALNACGPVTITNDHPSNIFNAGTTDVIWTASNGAGLTANCVTIVKVIEPIAPVVTAPASVTVNSTPGLCGAFVNINPVATDNCNASGNSFTKSFDYTGAIQAFPVPIGASSIRITAIGAAGGNSPTYIVGKGASMSGDFQVSFGDTLFILIGQQGGSVYIPDFATGGGGGTFVSKDRRMLTNLLIAAGGGGGAGLGGSGNASLITSGNAAGVGDTYGGSPGGVSGNGGMDGFAGSGAGWIGNGSFGSCSIRAMSPRNGAGGGGNLSCWNSVGGFGGGGGAYVGGGGGGGYSGGGGGDHLFGSGTYGGGGGSFNAGSSQVNTAAAGNGNGKVVLAYTCNFPYAVVSSGIPTGALFPIGTTLNTWTVYDASGNTATCSASISVLDINPPVITCPSDITTNVAAGECTATVSYPQPVIADNCCPTLEGNPGYTFAGSFGTHNYYMSTTIATWANANAAAIAAGGRLVAINSAEENTFINTARGNFTLWLGGRQNPSSPLFSEPAGGWEWTDGSPMSYTNWGPGRPSDINNADIALMTGNGTWADQSPTIATSRRYIVEFSCDLQLEQLSGLVSGSTFPIGTTTINWKLTDPAGNAATCSFNVTVTDNDNPGITLAPITGNGTTCVGTPLQLSDATSGGTWTSSNNAVATVDNNGLVTGISAGMAIIKYVITANGCERVADKTVSISATPLLASAMVNGITNVCPYIGTGTTLAYSISNAVAAVSYQWTVPPTVTIVAGQGTSSIIVRINAGFLTNANKQIRVKGIAPCGNSAEKIFYLIAQLPNTPQSITGNTNICAAIGTSTAITYKIPFVPGASSYIWTTQPGTTTVTHPNGPGAFDTVINVIYAAGFASSAITVQSVNECGTSGIRSLMINRTAASTPGLINGPTNACAYILPNGTAATYFITAIPGATSYNWTPAPGTIVTHPYTAANDTVITVKFPNGFTSGSISVTATNGCGTSAVRTLAISKLNPATPGVIDVIQTQACPGRTYSYTLASMPANATSVLWTVPANAINFTGQGTTSIIVSYPDAAVQGTVTAAAVSNCGTSTVRSTQVKLPACPIPGFSKGTGENNRNTIEQVLSLVISENNEMVAIPNPSRSYFEIRFDNNNDAPVYMQVRDMGGRLIEQKNITGAGKSISIGINYLPGIYFVQFTQDGKTKMLKLVKL